MADTHKYVFARWLDTPYRLTLNCEVDAKTEAEARVVAKERYPHVDRFELIATVVTQRMGDEPNG